MSEAAYQPNPTQVKAHVSNKKIKGFKGSKGSGKTRWMVEECIALSYEFPGNNGVIARLDLGDLKETTMKFFFDFCPPQMILDHNKAEHWVLLRSADPKKPSRIKFAHAKDAKSFESGEIGFFALDEADEIPYETFKTLRTRLRLKGVAQYGLLAFNPTDKFHWIYHFFVKEMNAKRAKTRELFSNTTEENMVNLPSDYMDVLRDTYEGDELKRYLYGEWGAITNDWAVWPEFRESIHVAKEPILPVAGIPIIRAHDFGMTAACSFHQFVDGVWNVLHPEVQEFGKGAEQFAPIVNQLSFNNYRDSAFIDVSEPFAGNRSTADASRTCQKVYADHGINLKIDNNPWSDRVGCVAKALTRLVDGKAMMQIDPRNEIIIGGMSGAYKYEKGTSVKTAHAIQDNDYTHLMDTLQMAGCRIMSKAISKLGPERIKRRQYGPPEHKMSGEKTVLTNDRRRR